MKYYRRQRNWDEVLRYGGLMLRQEPYDERLAQAYFDAAMSSGRRDVALQALQDLGPIVIRENPILAADLCYEAAKAYNDPKAAASAVALYGELARHKPDEPIYREKLEKALELQSRRPPATTKTQAPG